MADTAAADFSFMKAIVVKPHHASDDSQLELRLHDIVYVLEQDDSGWWGGHKEGQDNTGWFPGTCVCEVVGEYHEPNSEPQPTAATEPPTPPVQIPVEGDPVACRGAGADVGAGVHSALQAGNLNVATPTRAGAHANAPVRLSNDGLSALQAQNTTLTAITEDRALEIQRLQAELLECTTARRAEAAKSAAIGRQNEDLRRQYHEVEADNSELHQKVKELSAALDERKKEARQMDVRHREQLAKAQQDHEQLCKSYERRLQEREADVQELAERAAAAERACKAPVARENKIKSIHEVIGMPPAEPSNAPGRGWLPHHLVPERGLPETPMPPAETRTREMPPAEPSKAWDIIPQAERERKTALVGPPLANSREEHERLAEMRRGGSRPPANISHPFEAPDARRQGDGQWQSIGQRSRLGPGTTCPADRPMPGIPSTGLTKCLSTGDLPPTPRRTESEEPPVGSVAEKIALFQQIYGPSAQRARSAAPSRGATTTRSSADARGAHATHNIASQRSASTDGWRREVAQATASRAPFPRLDLPEVEEPSMDMGLSPMHGDARMRGPMRRDGAR